MALSETRQMIGLILKNDSTVTQEVKNEILLFLDGKKTAGLVDNSPLDRVLSRREVAEIMGVTARTVSAYARRGLIRPLRYGADAKRATGFSEQSVRAMLAK